MLAGAESKDKSGRCFSTDRETIDKLVSVPLSEAVDLELVIFCKPALKEISSKVVSLA